MTNDEYREQIKTLLDHIGETPYWLAKTTKLDKQSVYGWLDGRKPQDAKVWEKMLAAVEKEFEAFKAARKQRQMSLPETAPLLGDPKIPVGYKPPKMRFAGLVPAGDWGDPLDSEEFVDVDYRFEHPRRFAATVVGDSCWPALKPGDFTVWHSDLSPRTGVIVLAQRKGDHGCTVKELFWDEERRRSILRPVNPDYPEPEDGEGWGVIARLVGVERMVGGTVRMFYNQAGLPPEELS